PGSEFRQRTLAAGPHGDKVSIDNLFQRTPFQFTGELGLYNIRTRQSYRIATGQGDSEVLLVDNNVVYYRVNDAILKATLGSNKVDNTVALVRGANIQLAHWAFLA